MPARHTSLQNDLFPRGRFEPAALVDERGCRRDIRSNGWIVFSQRVRSFRNRSGRRNKFSSFGADRYDPQFHRRSNAQVKSGPDVFADALVLSSRKPKRRGAPISHPPHLTCRLNRLAGRVAASCPRRGKAPLYCFAARPTAASGSAAHPAASHSASKTRMNALTALRGVRGTRPFRWLSFPEMPG
jgi:hypothetical protein